MQQNVVCIWLKSLHVCMDSKAKNDLKLERVVWEVDQTTNDKPET